MRRDARSSTNPRYRNPSHVEMYEMSPHQVTSGASGVKSRFTRSGIRWSPSPMVVVRRFFGM